MTAAPRQLVFDLPTGRRWGRRTSSSAGPTRRPPRLSTAGPTGRIPPARGRAAGLRQDPPRQRVAPEVGCGIVTAAALMSRRRRARRGAASSSRTCIAASATSTPCSTCSISRASTSCRCCSPRAPLRASSSSACPTCARACGRCLVDAAAGRGPAEGGAGQAFRRPPTRRGAARDQLLGLHMEQSMEAASRRRGRRPAGAGHASQGDAGPGRRGLLASLGESRQPPNFHRAAAVARHVIFVT